MIRHPRLAGTALIASLALAGLTATARAARFVVNDELDPQEVSETTRLYADGTLIATIHLDAGHSARASIRVVVPDQPGPSHHRHDYALCGEIAFRDAAGRQVLHAVSGQGILDHPDGETLQALGASDFTLFYLADPADPASVTVRPGPAPFCQAPVS